MSNEKKTYETEILEAIHETIADLYEADLVNEFTMKEFDEMCFKPVEFFQPQEIKPIRQSKEKRRSLF